MVVKLEQEPVQRFLLSIIAAVKPLQYDIEKCLIQQDG